MRRSLFALIVSTLAAQPLPAQADSTRADTVRAGYPFGSQVRVWTSPTRSVSGYLRPAGDGGVVVRSKGIFSSSDHRIRAGSIVRMDVSRGRYVSGGRIVAGVLLGAAVGALSVATANWVIDETCEVDRCDDERLSYPAGVAQSAVMGGIAGALLKPHRWERVALIGRTGLAPGPRRWSVGMSINSR